MISLGSRLAVLVIVVGSIFYQFVIKDLVIGALGYGRTVRSLSKFPHWKCDKIDIPGLEACEDMWMHEETGYLYMACSSIQSHMSWLPPVVKFDLSKRHKTDRIGMLDTRGTGPVSSRLTWLTVENFPGFDGEESLDLHGISFLANSKSNMLRVLIINHRPPVDPVTNQIVSASLTGANTTIEHFLTEVGSSTIRHVRTHAHELIQTPNAVQWVNDHAFVLSNDHGSKLGIRRELEPLIPRGNIVYCDRNRCKTAVTGLSYPNGVTRSRDGLIYVIQLIKRSVEVYSVDVNGALNNIDSIEVPYPIDNLRIDSEGDIYGAAFPQAYKTELTFKDPTTKAPAAVVKISRKGVVRKGALKHQDAEIYRGGYTVETVLEDDGSFLPALTTALHDPKTGRIYMSGIMASTIAVCEAR